MTEIFGYIDVAVYALAALCVACLVTLGLIGRGR